jgi:SAM-dependent methyltransferase
MTACLLCGAALTEIFRKRDQLRPHDPTEYRIGWCRRCALGRVMDPTPPVNELFDVPYHTHTAATKSERKRKVLTRIAWSFDGGHDLDLPRPNRKARVCDIGCGDGRYLRRAKEQGYQVLGIEPDPIARGRAVAHAPIFDGTIEELPHEVISLRFDLVLVMHVLDACVDFRPAIASVRSILDDNGTLIVEVANCAAHG